MIKYAFDARSSKIILTGLDGDVYVDINNILATEDHEETTDVYLATGGETTIITVKDKTADIVAFIKQLADEQMAMRDAEAKAREQEFLKMKAEADAKAEPKETN